MTKTVRAVVVTSQSRPRMGKVCKHCAGCGVLVVPGFLRILPDKPKRAPRSAFLKHALNPDPGTVTLQMCACDLRTGWLSPDCPIHGEKFK